MSSEVQRLLAMIAMSAEQPLASIVVPSYSTPRRYRIVSYSAEPLYKADRNESCPCGSGSKFKRCCIGKVK